MRPGNAGAGEKGSYGVESGRGAVRSGGTPPLAMVMAWRGTASSATEEAARTTNRDVQATTSRFALPRRPDSQKLWNIIHVDVFIDEMPLEMGMAASWDGSGR